MPEYKRQRLQFTFDMSKSRHVAAYYFFKEKSHRTDILARNLDKLGLDQDDTCIRNDGEAAQGITEELIKKAINEALSDSISEEIKPVLEAALFHSMEKLIPQMISRAFSQMIKQAMIPGINRAVADALDKINLPASGETEYQFSFQEEKSEQTENKENEKLMLSALEAFGIG